MAQHIHLKDLLWCTLKGRFWVPGLKKSKNCEYLFTCFREASTGITGSFNHHKHLEFQGWTCHIPSLRSSESGQDVGTDTYMATMRCWAPWWEIPWYREKRHSAQLKFKKQGSFEEAWRIKALQFRAKEWPYKRAQYVQTGDTWCHGAGIEGLCLQERAGAETEWEKW